MRLFYQHEDPSLQAVLDRVLVDDTTPIVTSLTVVDNTIPGEWQRLPLGCMMTDHVCSIIADGHLHRNQDLAPTVELVFPYPTTNLLSYNAHVIQPGESLACTMSQHGLVNYKVEANMTRRAVVQHD